MMLYLFFIAAFILSLFLTRLIRSYSISHSVLDIPNGRSSHSISTPRGGGLSIAFISLGGLVLVWFLKPIWPWQKIVCYLIGSLLIISISWKDDQYFVPCLIRLLVHSIAAMFLIAGFGYWKIITIPFFGSVDLGWIGLIITFLWIVGLTNCYNFMDGIDGIAGSQAVIAGLGWFVIGFVLKLPLLEVIGMLVAASSLGFLFYNWPPASVFMGDVGSTFLGYTFAGLAVIISKTEPSLTLAGILLVWPFVFDSSVTFFRRLKNRENVFKAHRSHLYQRLVIIGYKHRTVTLLYIGLDFLGFLLALMILLKKPWTDFMIITLLPLACFCLWFFTIIREKNINENRETNFEPKTSFNQLHPGI